jgi:hypothetical protein
MTSIDSFLLVVNEVHSMTSCSSCGRIVQPNEKFCTSCGAPLGEMSTMTGIPPPPEGYERTGAEVVVGVIPHLIQATGGLKSKGWILISTNRRILLAQFSGPMMQEALAQSKAGAKGVMGKLLAGRVLLPADVVEYCRKYFQMSPEQVLVETPGNISLDLSEIRRAYIEYQLDAKDPDSHIRTDRYWLTILSNLGEYKYVFDADPQDMKVLRDALGERVHGEGRAKALKPTF